ncbi:uncharacterized protein KRP23_12104 [Phytophthora ramorum]|uniref:uncharacterized protein n=1 Tax=Phytophthora ramorum TaxID=164328 RepID=UPI0030A4C1FC|nr:hypothetical protein KRP23_12104 [Phytophthora ramorum]
MHVVAYKPGVPSRNPTHTSYVGLGGRTVRLEAPDELPGPWDGPAYATVVGDSQLRTEAPSPFFDDADGVKRPAWQVLLTFLLPGARLEDIDPALRECVEIPYWRLTQTSLSLTSELQERPLLSVFRFLRFTQFFVASLRNDTKFTKHTSDVFLCGQVLDYRPATSIALVDDIDLLQEPGCGYLYRVAIRGYAGERHQWPPRFDTAWRSFSSSKLTDRSSVRTYLDQAFPAHGADGATMIDLGTKEVTYVTPSGTKTVVVPADYAWNLIHPPRTSMGYEVDTVSPDATTTHQSAEAGLPLLTQADAVLTPSDQFSTLVFPRPQLAPDTRRVGTMPDTQGPGPDPSVPQTTQPTAGLSGEAVMQALF